jgi:hypothetical protein
MPNSSALFLQNFKRFSSKIRYLGCPPGGKSDGTVLRPPVSSGLRAESNWGENGILLEEGTFLRDIFDGLVKSLLKRHPGESRGPEHLEITGFRLSPE